MNVIAQRKRRPLFILSGKYGLLASDERIPYYNQLLIAADVGRMARVVTKQIKDNNIDVIDFYSKPKQGELTPYYDLIEKATKNTDIALNVFLM